MGVQFDRLFTDDLYLELGRHGIEMARRLRVILEEKGYPFYLQSPTNQQFIILENDQLEKLAQAGLAYSFWEKYDDNRTVIRLATSWSTSQEDLNELKKIL